MRSRKKQIMNNSNELIKLIEESDKIGIVGHIRPDGDCVGSTLGFYNYIRDNYPEKKVCVYLEEFSKDFMFLSGADKVKHEPDGEVYDLGVSIDCADTERHGRNGEIFKKAKKTVCIDHHISNKGFGDFCYIEAKASSASEVLTTLLDTDKFSKNTAECIYLGIVHDTGVFKYDSTSRRTMEIAGKMIELGAKPNFIIDYTFYKKTYSQNILMANALLNSKLHCGGRIISSLVTEEMFAETGTNRMDTDGIVDQLRITEGIEVAIFVYQTGNNRYKFSLRSNNIADVSKIAAEFGGGGHVRAAGFDTEGDYSELLEKIISMLSAQIEG